MNLKHQMNLKDKLLDKIKTKQELIKLKNKKNRLSSKIENFLEVPRELSREEIK